MILIVLLMREMRDARDSRVVTFQKVKAWVVPRSI